MIRFTQYMLPDGRPVARNYPCSEALSVKAQEFIQVGGFFEAEILPNRQVSLTACLSLDGEPQDIACEICNNGPEVHDAVDRLIHHALEAIV